ncbi:hypothetical protein DNU06_07955 [Putridiphycobacter roseus]|uniref:Secretion system C-terminal sorting domain-containing protein n=1 Tax=Putridiphycobacter roseus TaxID=2219161 RepID=A0A2W1NR84_9FLAO|nr:T9SS type A sorting domain-containing protein [Putridiphycobacter roseus]PZE17198.1 hypothetical protein DNU06_07955 [Putridiphycobacter roseus]
MKKLLLLVGVLVTSISFGQKLLNSTTNRFLDDFGAVLYADSIVFAYNTNYSYFNEFKPKFGFEGDIMYYFLEEFMVHADAEDIYSFQGSFPLTLSETNTNTLNNGLIAQSDNSSSNGRTLYTYTALSEVSSEVRQSFDGTNYNTYDSTVFEYDALGNKTYEGKYDIFQGITVLENVDSLSYQAGTSNLTEAVAYYYNGSNLAINNKTVVTWLNGNVKSVDLYFGDGSGNLSWEFRLIYQYTGSLADAFDAYAVSNNVIDPIAYIKGEFTYTPQNNVESYALLLDSIEEQKVVFSYDNENFLTEIATYATLDSTLELINLTNYYFTNVASVEQVSTLNIVLYPNPTTDFLHIQSETAIERLQIVNMNGQTMLTQNNSNDVDVSHLSKGTYIIYGNAADKSFKQTFVKQ